MRHRCATRLFDRTANQRKALFRGLIASLIEHERIETTVAKAKEVRKLAERIVTLGKKADLNSRRLAFAQVPNKAVIKKLFDEIAPRFTDRNGGYLRIIKTRSRIKDNAPLAVLEFVDYEETKMKITPKPETPDTAKAEAKKPAAEKKAAPKKKAEAKAPAKKAAKKTTAKKAAPKKETAEKKTAAKKKTARKSTKKKSS